MNIRFYIAFTITVVSNKKMTSFRSNEKAAPKDGLSTER